MELAHFLKLLAVNLVDKNLFSLLEKNNEAQIVVIF